MKKRQASIVLLLLVSAFSSLPGCDDQTLVRAWVDRKVKAGAEIEAYTLGVKACTWGVTATEMYRWLDTMVLDGSNPRAAPFNTFYHDRELAGPDYAGFDIPNSDTLYSYAWLDLTDAPVVVSTEASDGRYYSLQFIDFYSELIDYVGRRNAGSDTREVLVTGPGWRGEVPPGMLQIASPTAYVLLLARVLVSGPDDLDPARGVQQGWRIRQAGQQRNRNPVDSLPRRELARYRVENAGDYYDQLQYVVDLVPPKKKDRPHWRELSRIGLGQPGQRFSDLDARTRRSFQRACKHAPRVLDKALIEAGQAVGGGWAVSLLLGRYGDDYLQRSTVTRKGFGAHLPEEAVYFLAHFDADGDFLEGEGRYRIRFDAPVPAEGFWSLTLYDREHDKLVANPLQRYAIGDRQRGLQRDGGGGLTVYVQHDAPEDGLIENWLPAPEGAFYLALRLYLPEPRVLEGDWRPPAIERLP